MSPHRFEPARLVFGLLLLGVALTYAADALGGWDVPGPLLLVVVPAALVTAAFTALATYAVRRRLRKR
ncbi:MAG: hypothetical protein ACRDP3_18095 [Streptomyces sp.]|uniref:hypothetical protein n=1 Tax=Streptomyces sp. TaxID=1931 RepID=UPI003D6A85A9